jgi:hypothetical protein
MFDEVERAIAQKHEQVDAYSQQLALTAARLQSSVVAVLQQSSDLLSFFTSRGYATPEAITAVLNKMAASGTGMRALTVLSDESGGIMASPEVASHADARVLDWVAATSSSHGCTSAGAAPGVG